jgi:ADP-ribose pyrophosphatase YjhB (NUDIX family)
MPESQAELQKEVISPTPTAEIAVIVMDEKGGVFVGRVQEGIDKDKLSVPISRIQPFEPLADAARRTVLEWSGIDTEPQTTLFVLQSIHPEEGIHRVVIFLFSQRVKRVSHGGDSFWQDVRKLGEIQDELTEIAVDGFDKFSIVLKGMRNTKVQVLDAGPKQA